MKVLVVGSGGREHALAWALRRSPLLTELHAAPGNPGIASLGSCHPVRADDAEGLVALATALDLDLVVVGPEAPLVAGAGDELRRAGIPVLGPGREAARIEGSKLFAKEVLHAADVPAARVLDEARAPCVVKADGLAAGKGVFVCRTQDEADEAVARASALGAGVVVEELLEGEELSVFALCDGNEVVPLAAARDSKRAFDGDTGPNTGGMGAYSPAEGIDGDALDALVDAIHAPVVQELARRGSPFVGVLFAGLMLTDDGPRVLEFNCRLGDPESECVLPLLDGDLVTAFASAAEGRLSRGEVGLSARAAVTVVLTARSYPERGDVGTPIEGVEEASEDALVFHAGTAVRGGRLVTNGGRVLALAATGETVAEARDRAYGAVARVRCDALRCRTDIAATAAGREEHVSR